MATASPGARGIDDSREKRIPPMYDPPCPHGYVNGSCAECRRASLDAAAASEPDVGEMFERYTERHKGGQRSGWLIRRTEVTGELARLEGYARRSNAQEAELHELTSELTCLGSLIDQDDVRVRGEQAEAAELFLALSDPHYAQAFRSVLRYPADFMAGGTGYLSWSDEERTAWSNVRQNMACRAAFAETSGAVGAFALPLQLDPQIILTNAGSANPFRRLARNVVGTSNVWEGITSAGTTANWLAEGTAVTDTTPAIGDCASMPYKESRWIFRHFAVLDDTLLDTQVPALIADAKDRLETVAFCSGTGSGQPFGIVVHGTTDATVGALTAAMVYALHTALPPRFRNADGARPE